MLFASTLALLACLATTSFSSEYDGFLAPLEGMDVHTKWPNEYVVLFHENHTLEEHFQHIGRNLSSSLKFRRYSFGYQATMDNTTRDELVRRDPGVQLLETNRPAHVVEPHDVDVFEDYPEPSRNETSLLSERNFKPEIQEDAPYGLQMLTTPEKRLDIPIGDNGIYKYLYHAGQGVQVYVMDGGVRTTHVAFEGRARHFGGLGPNDKSPYTDATMADVRGHGTHVAGIIGAEQFGVAPKANLINVKVVNNRGTIDEHGPIAQALLDIITEHNKNKKKYGSVPLSKDFRGSVINMSFGWVGDSGVLLRQLIKANEAGISVFAAAGNKNEGDGDFYPCANVQVKCIAAVDNTYHKWKASNYGRAVNYVAPGKHIISLHSKSDIAKANMSGTSQASPHAAGAAALFASWQGLETKSELSERFVELNALDGLVTGFKNTRTKLINTGINSPHKGPHEPFRKGEDWPRHPHRRGFVDENSPSLVPSTASVPADQFVTTAYTDTSTETVGPVPGLTMIPDVIPDFDVTDAAPTATTTPNPNQTPNAATNVPNCAASGTPFSQPAAQKFISSFCGQSFLDAQFVPFIAFGNGSTQLNKRKSAIAEGHFPLEGTTNMIWFRTRFTDKKHCVGTFKGTYQCAERFSAILNGCHTDTTTSKLGGTLTSVCAEYEMTVVDQHTNPFKDEVTVMGDFTCEDTQSPSAQLYPNTCTCWMSNIADQKAVFAKPLNGVCEGKSVDQMDGLVPGQGY